MTFKTAFPDYPADDIPGVFLAAPWRDVSWHNDACPSFALTLPFQNREAHVYVDYADPTKRELEQIERFCIRITDDEGCFSDDSAKAITSLATNSLAHALVFVEEQTLVAEYETRIREEGFDPDEMGDAEEAVHMLLRDDGWEANERIIRLVGWLRAFIVRWEAMQERQDDARPLTDAERAHFEGGVFNL